MHHTIIIGEKYGNSISLTVGSFDTDVLIILLNYYKVLPQETNILTGRGKTRRTIWLKHITATLGPVITEAILGFHAFTGTDITGKFFRKSKEMCFRIFLGLNEDDSVLKSFSLLGSEETPYDEMNRDFERFVCMLYKSTITSVKELRWKLYSIKVQQGENLPPTLNALEQHNLR